jgi:hypothetical protein
MFGIAATGAGVSVYKQLNEEDLSPWIHAMSLLPLSLLSNKGRLLKERSWLPTLRRRSRRMPFLDPEQQKQKRPRQDSNLRHRLRRASWFVQAVLSVCCSALELASESTP